VTTTCLNLIQAFASGSVSPPPLYSRVPVVFVRCFRLWGALDAAVKAGELTHAGSGARNDPFRYGPPASPRAGAPTSTNPSAPLAQVWKPDQYRRPDFSPLSLWERGGKVAVSLRRHVSSHSIRIAPPTRKQTWARRAIVLPLDASVRT
jgi:hypothetical protein